MSSKYSKNSEIDSLPIIGNAYKNIFDIAAGLSQLKSQFAALYSFYRNLGHLLDKQHLLRTISEHAKEVLIAKHCAIYELDSSKKTFNLEASTTKNLPETIPALGEDGTTEIIDWIETQIINKWTYSTRFKFLQKYFGNYNKLILVPLIAEGNLNGFMVFLERNTELGDFVKDDFDSEDKQLAEMIAHVAATAILLHRLRSKILVEQSVVNEIETAAQIQRLILPNSPPEINGWRIGFAHYSAGSVNGDYFNFYKCQNGLLMVIADIMGHGIPAAMFISALHIALIDAISNNLWKPSDIVNSVAFKLEDLFITTNTLLSILAVYIPNGANSDKILVSGAGAPTPIIVRENQMIKCNVDIAPMLGATQFRKGDFIDTKIGILPNDIVVLFTDGIVDALSDLGTRFGENGIFNTIKLFSNKSRVDLLAKAILEKSRKWSENSLLDDDRTIVVLRNLWNKQLKH